MNNVAKRLKQEMETRAAAPTEKHESQISRGIIPQNERNKEANHGISVTELPELPDENERNIHQSVDLHDLFLPDDFYYAYPNISSIEEFIKSAPELGEYFMEIVDEDEGKSAYVAYNNDDGKQIIISRVPYYHLSKTHNIDTHIEGCILVGYREGTVRTLLLQMSDIAEPKKLVTMMSNRGLLITKGAANRDYIYTQNLKCKDTIFLSDRIGFRDIDGKLAYVYPNGMGIGFPISYSRVDPEIKHAVCVSGDVMQWAKGVIEPLNLQNDRPTVPFLLFSALLPLFSSLIPGFHGMLINIAPDTSEKLTSSVGKTTLQKAMLSLQGAPQWMGSWDTTANAIESKLNDGMAAYLDDLSTSSIKNMEKVVYSNANGTQRARLNRDGTAKPVKHRNSVIFSSGEAQVLDIDMVKDGAIVRAIDVFIRTSDFGSEDLNHTKEVADSIVATSQYHYGFVYYEAIHMIISNKDALLVQIEEYKQHFVAMADNALSKRLALPYAIITVCGYLMIEAVHIITRGETSLEHLDPIHIVSAMFRKTLRKLESRQDKYLLVLEEIKQSIMLDESTILDMRRNPIGVKEDDTWYIKSTEVKNIVSSVENITAKHFFAWAYTEGYICETDNEEGRYNKTKKINGNAVKTYAFNFTVKSNGNTGNEVTHNAA